MARVQIVIISVGEQYGEDPPEKYNIFTFPFTWISGCNRSRLLSVAPPSLHPCTLIYFNGRTSNSKTSSALSKPSELTANDIEKLLDNTNTIRSLYSNNYFFKHVTSRNFRTRLDSIMLSDAYGNNQSPSVAKKTTIPVSSHKRWCRSALIRLHCSPLASVVYGALDQYWFQEWLVR